MTSQEISKLAYKFYVDMQIEEMLPLDEYEIYVKPKFNTASWRFYNGKHQVVIGEDIFKNIVINITDKQKIKYVRAFLYHELAHSIWTSKDLKTINEVLIEGKFAFEVFNLFEDARIEEKMRQHTKLPFNWTAYELLSTPTNALEMLFYIVQCEHKHSELLDMKKQMDQSQYNEFKIVFDFYKKIVACKGSINIIQVMREWYAQFPLTVKYLEPFKERNHLFYEESKSLSNGESFDELIYGLENVLSLDETSHSNHPILNNHSTSSDLLSSKPETVAFDIRQRDMLLEKMKKLFFVNQRAQSSAMPSKRLNIKRLAHGDEKMFKRKSIPKLSKKKITIILDLSGSMHSIIKNMRLLIDVLDKMALNEIIDATLILSAVVNGTAKYEILQMPLSENTIERLCPVYEAEGLYNTMIKNIDLLSSSDFVWILTDGMIGENTLDKDYFNKKKIKTHAMYIGDTSYKSEMQKSFDYVICEKDVDDLAKVVFGLIS